MSRYSRNSQAGVELPKAKLNRESIRQALALFRYLRPYRLRFGAALVSLFTGSLLSLSFPYLAGSIVDAAVLQTKGMGTMGGVDRTALLLVGILALQASLSYFHFLSFATVGQRSLVDLRRDTYARLISLPMTFFAQRRVGELASRLSADLIQIEDTLISILPQFLRQTTLLVGGIALIAVTSLKLTGIMLVSLPVLTVVAVIFGRKTRKIAREAQDRLADTATIVEETLQGIVNVKAFANESYELNRYHLGLTNFLTATLRGARLRAAFIAFIIFALFGSIVLVLWSGARLLQQGEITFGDLTRFILYTTFVAGAMGQFAELYSQLQKAIGATQRVRELLRETGEVEARLGPLPASTLARLRGDVVFENVHFTYPSRQGVEVLHAIHLSASPGQRIALVGPSGAGKSTLISLLLRLYDPSSGRLLIDGRDARDYNLAELRGQMSMVPQEVLLFGGTISENIAYGKPGATAKEIEQAARQANAHDFIRGFPEGYATLVGDRGIKLSGGQRQRVAIARAVLKNPAILILDEATSSLDSESEKLIQEALETLMQGRTSFIIAHRLATVRHADRIIVVADGRVVESGTHDELQIIPNGVYRRLAALQFRD
ncbi:MAG TPA: ABC transporter transmembrane domain-containing protein [Candidatus Saccharimonadales bacterium]|nr:ABC transporter transmembrane domain-containing protein [Candidatus Saccharimonadales bacterium]